MNQEQLKTWIEDNLDWYGIDEDIMEQIEENFMIEWSDEWYQCCDCGKSIRTQPDCYHWQPYYHMFNDCEPVCFDCISENAGLQESLIEDFIIKGNEIDIDKDSVNFRLLQVNDFELEDHGFKVLNQDHYENGFHPGQDDNPKTILKNLDVSFLESNQFLFKQSEQSQFYMKFDLYSKPIN